MFQKMQSQSLINVKCKSGTLGKTVADQGERQPQGQEMQATEERPQ